MTILVRIIFSIISVLKREDDAEMTTNEGFSAIHIYSKTNKPIDNNWNGLFVSMLGDSISSYQGYMPTENISYYNGSNHGVSSVYDMWWYKAITGMGGIPLIMDAWSGSCVGNQLFL